MVEAPDPTDQVGPVWWGVRTMDGGAGDPDDPSDTGRRGRDDDGCRCAALGEVGRREHDVPAMSRETEFLTRHKDDLRQAAELCRDLQRQVNEVSPRQRKYFAADCDV